MKTEIINLLQTTQALDGGNQGINAREVHRLLKVGRDYSTWIKARIKQAGFIENQDFAIVENLSSPILVSANNEQPSPMARSQKQIDYIVSLDMAKHLCLMEKNEIGRAVRQHFIDAERQLRLVAPKVYKNTLAKTQARLAAIDHNREMTDAIKATLQRTNKAPKPFYYSREQELLDSLVLGENVRQWKKRQGINGNVRDQFTTAQLKTLKALQSTNTVLINLGMNYYERKGRLTHFIEQQGLNGSY
ncbi:antA/AntB antirepressor family protein [Aggregatibacter actinomycetemcomitans]|uniref:antA/AntB antirepressor family protein n=1 Tax=Aggregatibacter actinomycetemcomitans TaxID=714 RepID=UPI00197C494A|nr:antA/AntB antirepressor family protein [Aggregatibacter actinomycetemcomitans]MBN6075333.1 antA/AntB antirepressor family protein [Aggregatibacter actinomycetemcomitans]